MTNRAQFAGTVTDAGELRLFNEAGYRAILKHLAGKRVVVAIGPPLKKTSDKQRRYYFAVIVAMLAEELGYTKDEMHEILKWKWLRVYAEPEGGRQFDTVRSTESLTTAEREKLHEDIRIWAASDLGIAIPLPHEVLEA